MNLRERYLDYERRQSEARSLALYTDHSISMNPLHTKLAGAIPPMYQIVMNETHGVIGDPKKKDPFVESIIAKIKSWCSIRDKSNDKHFVSILNYKKLYHREEYMYDESSSYLDPKILGLKVVLTYSTYTEQEEIAMYNDKAYKNWPILNNYLTYVRASCTSDSVSYQKDDKGCPSNEFPLIHVYVKERMMSKEYLHEIEEAVYHELYHANDFIREINQRRLPKAELSSKRLKSINNIKILEQNINFDPFNMVVSDNTYKQKMNEAETLRFEIMNWLTSHEISAYLHNLNVKLLNSKESGKIDLSQRDIKKVFKEYTGDEPEGKTIDTLGRWFHWYENPSEFIEKIKEMPWFVSIETTIDLLYWYDYEKVERDFIMKMRRLHMLWSDENCYENDIPSFDDCDTSFVSDETFEMIEEISSFCHSFIEIVFKKRIMKDLEHAFKNIKKLIGDHIKENKGAHIRKHETIKLLEDC